MNQKKTRQELYQKYKTQFAQSPIRLISKINAEAQKIFQQKNQKYDGYAGAIGDINLKTFSQKTQKGLFIQNSQDHLTLITEGEKIISQEDPHFMSYDYSGTGLTGLKKIWQKTYAQYTDQAKNFHNYIFYGGMGAFFNVMKAISKRKTNHINKILVPTPSFPPFFFQLEQYYDLHYYHTAQNKEFKLQANDIKHLGHESLEVVYLIVVGNPTGISYTKEELKSLLNAILQKNPQSIILLDAVYVRTLPVPEAKTLWKVMFNPKYQKNVVIFDSLSKTYGRTGLRSGVIFINNEEIEKHINTLMQNELAGISYAMQLESAGILSLINEEAIQTMSAEIAKRRKKFLDNFLPKYKNYILPLNQQTLIPKNGLWQGGLYAFLELTPETDPIEFFLKTGIACVSGKPFFANKTDSNFIRVSFGMEEIV